ncbi:alkaline phosphatase [Blastomonas sp.]|uniref:alkaline phosphatase D family protein n=1 Tax=Blastomonas sp. TaxID=1909299 RepID=UPI0035934260
MLSRRLFVAAAPLGLIAAPGILRAQSLFRTFPFALGIASGDPAPDGFVIWTRLAPDPLEAHGGMVMVPMEVTWDVASDDRFATIVANGTVVARPEMAHAVHVEVGGLQPNRPYWYRFSAGGERSFSGKARTLPAVGATVNRLKFGVVGCQNYEDGYFGAYNHLAREELDFVFHYGDYIYEYRGSPTRANYFGGGLQVPVRQHVGQMLYDVADYRRRYAQYKSDTDLQRAHAAHSFFPTFDDHEIENNWVAGVSGSRSPADAFELRRAAALQAWYEHMPVRKANMPRFGSGRFHRTARFGNLAEIQLLDTRSYRTDQPCDDGFKPLCDGVRDTNAQVLGAEQEAWLAKNLSGNQARWNCLAQQIMMMSLDRRRAANEDTRIANMDSWAAYEVPRQRMLARMSGLGNVVVLTGDEHQNFVGDLVHRDRLVGTEIVSTSISSGGDGSDLRAGSDQFMQFNPELKFVNDQRGYVVCEVTPDAWLSHIQVVDKVTTPTNSLKRRATAEIAHGVPGARMTGI